jgi:glutamate dehydrogenase (NAD(P)+)
MVIEKDDFGPEKILEVYDPKTGMRGFTCLFSTVLGEAKGGIRMTTSVSREEVFRLAREMAWKCAIADLPFGGGKSGIVADGKNLDPEKKKEIVQAFAKAISPICPSQYVAAPDVYMAEREMQWFAEVNGDKSCTGKPEALGGIPHEYGSTGFGVAHATRVALVHAGIDINGATVAIEGFGNVGTFAMKFLTEWGAKIVAVTDSRGGIYNAEGLNYDELMKTKQETRSVVNHSSGEKIEHGKIFTLDVDVLIPAALADVINDENKNNVKAKIIIEGANISMSYAIEEELEKKGIVVVPDFVANGGGVISSYVEHIGGTVEQMWEMVETKIVANTQLVLQRAKEKGIIARSAALEIAQERIRVKRGF